MVFNQPVKTLVAGDLVIHHSGGIENLIRGSGVFSQECRKVERTFNALEVQGSASVQLTIGDFHSIEVTGDANLLKFVDMYFDKNTLRIGTTPGVSYGTNLPLVINITVPIIKKVELMGSGNIKLTGLHQDSISVALKGSGDVIASGTVENIDIVLQGSGEVITEDLEASTAAIWLQGSGNVKTFVSQSVKVWLSGSGNVNVSGQPKFKNAKRLGTGHITFC